MNLAVTLVGIAIGLLAAVGIFAPFRVLRWISEWNSPTRFAVAVAQRAIIGPLFMWAAPECRTPRIVFWLGAVTLAAAIALLIMGRKRFDGIVAWWSGLPTGVSVMAFALAALFGCFLVYAGW